MTIEFEFPNDEFLVTDVMAHVPIKGDKVVNMGECFIVADRVFELGSGRVIIILEDA